MLLPAGRRRCSYGLRTGQATTPVRFDNRAVIAELSASRYIGCLAPRLPNVVPHAWYPPPPFLVMPTPELPSRWTGPSTGRENGPRAP